MPDTALAAAGARGSAGVWELPSGRLQGRLEYATTAPNDITFSPDGQLLATSNDDGTGTVWDVTSLQRLATFPGHNGLASSVAFDPTGTVVATAGNDGAVDLWDPFTGIQRAELRHGGQPLLHVTFASRDLLYATADDGTVSSWRPTPGDGVGTFPAQNAPLDRMSVSADGQVVAASGPSGTLTILSSDGSGVVRTFQADEGWFGGQELSSDGGLLATADANSIDLWDVGTGRRQWTVPIREPLVTSVAFTSDDQQVLAIDDSVKAQVLDTTTGGREASHRHERPDDNNDLAGPVGADAARERFVVGTLSGPAWLWGVSSSSAPLVLEGHTNGVISAAFTDNGSVLVTASYDGTVGVWDTSTGELLDQLVTDRSAVDALYSVALDDSGTLVFAGDSTGRVIVWNRMTEQVIATLHVHENKVVGLAYDAAHDRVISMGEEGSIRSAPIVTTVDEACDLLDGQVDPDELADVLGTTHPKGCTNLSE